eukprot:936835_1
MSLQWILQVELHDTKFFHHLKFAHLGQTADISAQCVFGGQRACTDHLSAPTRSTHELEFNTTLQWRFSDRSLQEMKARGDAIKVQFAATPRVSGRESKSAYKHPTSTPIGYIVLSLRDAVTGEGKVRSRVPEWHKLRACKYVGTRAIPEIRIRHALSLSSTREEAEEEEGGDQAETQDYSTDFESDTDSRRSGEKSTVSSRNDEQASQAAAGEISQTSNPKVGAALSTQRNDSSDTNPELNASSKNQPDSRQDAEHDSNIHISDKTRRVSLITKNRAIEGETGNSESREIDGAMSESRNSGNDGEESALCRENGTHRRLDEVSGIKHSQESLFKEGLVISRHSKCIGESNQQTEELSCDMSRSGVQLSHNRAEPHHVIHDHPHERRPNGQSEKLSSYVSGNEPEGEPIKTFEAKGGKAGQRSAITESNTQNLPDSSHQTRLAQHQYTPQTKDSSQNSEQNAQQNSASQKSDQPKRNIPANSNTTEIPSSHKPSESGPPPQTSNRSFCGENSTKIHNFRLSIDLRSVGGFVRAHSVVLKYNYVFFGPQPVITKPVEIRPRSSAQVTSGFCGFELSCTRAHLQSQLERAPVIVEVIERQGDTPDRELGVSEIPLSALLRASPHSEGSRTMRVLDRQLEIVRARRGDTVDRVGSVRAVVALEDFGEADGQEPTLTQRDNTPTRVIAPGERITNPGSSQQKLTVTHRKEVQPPTKNNSNTTVSGQTSHISSEIKDTPDTMVSVQTFPDFNEPEVSKIRPADSKVSNDVPTKESNVTIQPITVQKLTTTGPDNIILSGSAHPLPTGPVQSTHDSSKRHISQHAQISTVQPTPVTSNQSEPSQHATNQSEPSQHVTTRPQESAGMDQVRSGLAYQMAWELEMWKREEQAKFLEKIEKDEVKHRKELDAEYKKKAHEIVESQRSRESELTSLETKLQAVIAEVEKQEKIVQREMSKIDQDKLNHRLQYERKKSEVLSAMRLQRQEYQSELDVLKRENTRLQTQSELAEKRLDQTRQQFEDYKKSYESSPSARLKITLDHRNADISRLKEEVKKKTDVDARLRKQLMMCLQEVSRLRSENEILSRKKSNNSSKNFEDTQVEKTASAEQTEVRGDVTRLRGIKSELQALMRADIMRPPKVTQNPKERVSARTTEKVSHGMVRERAPSQPTHSSRLNEHSQHRDSAGESDPETDLCLTEETQVEKHRVFRNENENTIHSTSVISPPVQIQISPTMAQAGNQVISLDVTRLQRERSRLLSTGVYAPTHRLVRELDARILVAQAKDSSQ